MDRRGFLSAMIGGLAAAAAVRTFPFRVYSFPSEIKLASVTDGSELWATDSRFSIALDREIVAWEKAIPNLGLDTDVLARTVLYSYEVSPHIIKWDNLKRLPFPS